MAKQKTLGKLISFDEFCDLCASDNAVMENLGGFTVCRICEHPEYGNVTLIQNAGESECLMFEF